MNPGEKFGFSVIVEAIPAVNTNKTIKKFEKMSKSEKLHHHYRILMKTRYNSSMTTK